METVATPPHVGAASAIERQLQVQHAAQKPYEKLIELWARAFPAHRDNTREQYGKVVQSFAAFVGYKQLGEIARKDVVTFRDTALASGQSTATASNKISILKRLFNVAISHELMDGNPADNVRTQINTQTKSRVAFSAADLQRIFKSAIYTNDYKPQSGGQEACFWLPLLALYTGARVEELAQLLVADVRFIAELGHYLNISDEAEHAKLKNTASRRRVPIHPVLVACGFIDYVQQMKPNQLLFPHLKTNPRGKLGGYFSNFFSIYLRQRVGITDKRKVFHSFRHTFKDTCRRVGIEEAVHDALTGHTGNSVSRKYGNEQYPLEPLFEAMARFEITDLDLSHLYRRPLKRNSNKDLKLIAAFYGVMIGFSAARSNKQQAPFVMALCDGAEAAVEVASNKLLFGQLPANKLLLVNAWVEIHREELVANWHAGQITGEFFKLDPLR